MFLWLVLCCTIVCSVNANIARQSLQRVPPPVPDFNAEAGYGLWYSQYRLPGCGFDSSDVYTDYVQFIARHKKGLVSYDTWRNSAIQMCNTLSTMYFVTGTPGVFRIKDAIGSVWSGLAIYTAVDSKRYKILYGCSKMSAVGDLCDDPFLNIYTRMPKPDPMTLAEIDARLRQMFGISLSSIPRTFHGKHLPHRTIKWADSCSSVHSCTSIYMSARGIQLTYECQRYGGRGAYPKLG